MASGWVLLCWELWGAPANMVLPKGGLVVWFLPFSMHCSRLLPLMEGQTLLLSKPTWSVKAHGYTSNLLVAIIKAFSFPMKNKAGHCNVVFFLSLTYSCCFSVRDPSTHCMMLHFALSSWDATCRQSYKLVQGCGGPDPQVTHTGMISSVLTELRPFFLTGWGPGCKCKCSAGGNGDVQNSGSVLWLR